MRQTHVFTEIEKKTITKKKRRKIYQILVCSKRLKGKWNAGAFEKRFGHTEQEIHSESHGRDKSYANNKEHRNSVKNIVCFFLEFFVGGGTNYLPLLWIYQLISKSLTFFKTYFQIHTKIYSRIFKSSTFQVKEKL